MTRDVTGGSGPVAVACDATGPETSDDAIPKGIILASLHHVQLAMPEGGEDSARAFYANILGFHEVPKPALLRARGGVWFERGAIRLHLGVETPFHPARKAHPAFAVTVLADATAHLDSAGIAWVGDIDLPGLRRIYLTDPFGNRIEICEPATP